MTNEPTTSKHSNFWTRLEGGRRIGISRGMAGWFAVKYDSEGAIQTGVGHYARAGEAHEEAQGWAISEMLPLDPLVGCPNDTDGDGNCGMKLCLHCGTHPQSKR